jgi:hypothetical protein|tara:strand:- start:14891 stop:15073 length:183 start_codon:yes stop_codon:yes gene_type:complete
MSKVDRTFLPRRKAQIFAQLTSEDAVVAAQWLTSNVPEKERDDLFIKYLREELKKYEPAD